LSLYTKIRIEINGDSVQLDEVALQRSQSIAGKTMKAVLRAKKRADKEREELIDRFAIDSIAANKEQLEGRSKRG